MLRREDSRFNRSRTTAENSLATAEYCPKNECDTARLPNAPRLNLREDLAANQFHRAISLPQKSC